MKTKIKVVCCAVVDEAGRYLAAKRSNGRFAGKWEFPGGKLEEGETPEDACVRELVEELGLRVNQPIHFYTDDLITPEIHYELLFYKCKSIGFINKMITHSEVRWLKPDELDGLDWLDGDLGAIRKLSSLSNKPNVSPL